LVIAIYYQAKFSHYVDMSEYESGTFRCTDCAKEFLTKEEADRHYVEYHSHITIGEWFSWNKLSGWVY